MDNSLLAASKRAQSYKKYFSGRAAYIAWPLLALLLAGPFAYGYFSQSLAKDEAVVKLIEVAPKKTDLSVAIPADGRLVSDKNIELLFALTGIIKDVSVKDGQAVKKGDKIASLDARELELSLASAKTAKSIAVANLLTRQAGPSQFDVKLAENNIVLGQKRLDDVKRQNIIDIKNADLALGTAKLNLEAVQKEAANSLLSGFNDVSAVDLRLSQSYDEAIIKAGQSFNEVEAALREADAVLAIGSNAIDGDLDEVLGVLNHATVIESETAFTQLLSLKNTYYADYQAIKIGSGPQKILEKLNASIVLAESASQLMHKVSLALDASIVSYKLTQAELDAYKTSINSQHVKMKGQIEALNNAKQAIVAAQLEKTSKGTSVDGQSDEAEAKLKLSGQQYEAAKIQLENARAKAAVNEREAVSQLEIAKTQLSLKTEPVREVDIASLRAQITQADNQISEAQYRLSLAVIVAPADGHISSLSAKTGDTWFDKNKPLAVLVNKNNFSIETSIEEIDVAKIKKGQKAYATFDALEGVKLEGVVEAISDTPEIDANGVVSYMVRVVISDRKGAELKDGMTAYLDFILAEAKSVLALPVSAIKSIGGKSSVSLVAGGTKQVETGFTDGKLVEIVSGLEPADKVYYAE